MRWNNIANIYVFVYGSLKQDFHNNWFIEHCRFLGEDVTLTSEWDMVSFGAYPAVVDNGNSYIKGEVYEIDDEALGILDQLEGYPSFYDRKLIKLKTFDKPVWIYYLTDLAMLEFNYKYINRDGNILTWTKPHEKEFLPHEE